MTRAEILPGASARQAVSLAPSPLPRCAEGARARGEAVAASAAPYRRYLLLEVPGPWGSAALDERHLGARVARSLAPATAEAGMNVLLIRRPGRHRAGGGRRAWALADTAPGAERITWGAWEDPEELLDLPDRGRTGTLAAAGPQRVALICTNGKRDQCCAILGRPVADALAAVPGWDAWECTHLGGHRFAATAMLLPTGDMFGWLDRQSAELAVRRFDAGQFLLSHYRGRSGQPLPVQAALHAAAVRLGDPRRHAFAVTGVRQLPAGRWEVLVSHRPAAGGEAGYQVTVAQAAVPPAFLSCADESPKAEVRYAVISFASNP